MSHKKKKIKLATVREVPAINDDAGDDDDFEEPVRIRINNEKNVVSAQNASEASNDAALQTRNYVFRPMNPRKRKLKFRELTSGLPKLHTRTSPFTLQKTIDSLNDIQKRDVKDIGFGHILTYKMSQVPTQLAYWVLENFDPKSKVITLQQGRSIRVEEDDVYRVLGFPKGTIQIESKVSCSRCLLECWAAFFPDNQDSVVPQNVADKIKEFANGGEWFKRLFMVLVIGTLVGNSSNGYIGPNTMSCLEDTTKLRELNWGEFVLSSLVKHRVLWDEKRTKPFFGPSFFLTAFYVDRVELYRNKVPRLFPTCINWDYFNLKERLVDEVTSGSFGGGYPIPPVKADYEQDLVVSYRLETSETVNDGQGNKNAATKQNIESDFDHYAEKFLAMAKTVAVNMVKLMELVQEVPEHVMYNMKLKRMIDSARSLLGCNVKEPILPKAQTLTRHAMMEEAYDLMFSDEMVATCEEVEQAVKKLNKFVKRDDDMASSSFLTREDVHVQEENYQSVVDKAVDNADMRDDFNQKDLNDVTHVADKTTTNETDFGMPSFRLLTQEDVLVQGDKYQSVVDEAVDNADMRDDIIEKDLNDVTHVAKKLTTNETSFGMPSFRLLTQEDVPAQEDKYQYVVNEVVENADMGDDIIQKDLNDVTPVANKRTTNDTESGMPSFCLGVSPIGVDQHTELVRHDVGDRNDIASLDDIFLNELGVPVKHHMLRRSKQEIKKTEILLSPYIVRPVDVNEKLNQTEMELAYYALHNERGLGTEILFDDGNVQLHRGELLTMKHGSPIRVSIVDVWAIILNFRKALRSNKSSFRFFATTDTTYESIVMPPKNWPKKRCFETFAVKLQIELNKSEKYDVRNIDMFFFTIYEVEHFYVICFDVKKGNIYLIDNENKYKRDCNRAKYGRTPIMLRDMFVAFMKQRDQGSKMRKIEKAATTIVDLSWVDKKKEIDCAIYTMRHMETFMGETAELKWNTGLKTRMKNQMKCLRIRYCADIMASENNILRHKLLDSATLHYQGACDGRPLFLNPILMHNE